jgi:light-harvesting complex I chlorophyll a/b binding protein 4
MKTTVFLLFATLANAFNFGYVDRKPVIVGDTKPLGEFDPLKLSQEETGSRKLFFREAELKHGRLGMISALSIPITEQITHRPAIFELSNNINLFYIILSLMMAAETTFMVNGWENPFTTNKYFKLKETYQPGDLGFTDIQDFSTPENIALLNKELNNGRLAMIASLGMIAQELVTNQPLL